MCRECLLLPMKYELLQELFFCCQQTEDQTKKEKELCADIVQREHKTLSLGEGKQVECTLPLFKLNAWRHFAGKGQGQEELK